MVLEKPWKNILTLTIGVGKDLDKGPHGYHTQNDKQ